MSRKVRMADVAEAASWVFGTGLDARPVTRRVTAARKVAYAACRELGFTWREIGTAFDREYSTCAYALKGAQPDPEDVEEVLKVARLLAENAQAPV